MIHNTQIAYNRLAHSYDSETVALEAFNFIKIIKPYITGKVFDVGCGTGLAIKAFEISPENYLGIEPNKEMVKVFINKYPNYKIMRAFYEETDFSGFDTMIALHGVGAYIDPNHYKRLAENGKYLIMFYKEDFYPWFYGPETCKQIKENQDRTKIESTFEYVFNFFVYTIATNIPELQEVLKDSQWYASLTE